MGCSEKLKKKPLKGSDNEPLQIFRAVGEDYNNQNQGYIPIILDFSIRKLKI